jgi:hypothetical protein
MAGRPGEVEGAPARALGMAAAALAVAVAAGAGAPVGSAPPAAPLPPVPQQVAVPYDGRFTFARVRFGSSGGRGFGRRGFGGGQWNHDYPNADLNMQVILKEVTTVNPVTASSVVVDLEDRAIFRHPILYLSEPGFWGITEEGARNLREYLLKGGFIIFDDFDGYGHWENWEAQIRQVLPEHRPIEIDQSHPVFRTFFLVEDIYVPHPMAAVRPRYLGIFENNDPTRRMLALVNYNADLAEYWEWSASGYLPIDPTNDAYRLGVNYFIYGLTH